MMALVAVLVLQPVVDADGPVRLVATGVGPEEVTWLLDGVEVARTGDREAAVVHATAGPHELRAASNATGRWTAMARPDGEAHGAAYVAAWSATHEGVGLAAAGSGRSWPQAPPLALGLGVLALLLAAWPGRSGLEALRRLRRR